MLAIYNKADTVFHQMKLRSNEDKNLLENCLPPLNLPGICDNRNMTWSQSNDWFLLGSHNAWGITTIWPTWTQTKSWISPTISWITLSLGVGLVKLFSKNKAIKNLQNQMTWGKSKPYQTLSNLHISTAHFSLQGWPTVSFRYSLLGGCQPHLASHVCWYPEVPSCFITWTNAHWH